MLCPDQNVFMSSQARPQQLWYICSCVCKKSSFERGSFQDGFRFENFDSSVVDIMRHDAKPWFVLLFHSKTRIALPVYTICLFVKMLTFMAYSNIGNSAEGLFSKLPLSPNSVSRQLLRVEQQSKSRFRHNDKQRFTQSVICKSTYSTNVFKSWLPIQLHTSICRFDIVTTQILANYALSE